MKNGPFLYTGCSYKNFANIQTPSGCTIQRNRMSFGMQVRLKNKVQNNQIFTVTEKKSSQFSNGNGKMIFTVKNLLHHPSPTPSACTPSGGVKILRPSVSQCVCERESETSTHNVTNNLSLPSAELTNKYFIHFTKKKKSVELSFITNCK